MFKNACKKIIKNYNIIIQYVNNHFIAEKGNPYGHVSEFNILKQGIKADAHRVISPLALMLVGIEDTYSVTDINGNTYDFDIFEDGYYRVSEVRKLKDKVKEKVDGKYYR